MMMARAERSIEGVSQSTEDFSMSSMSASPRTPFLALRRQGTTDSRSSSISTTTDTDSLPQSRNSSVASISSTKLTGSPGFVYMDPESQTPTKMLPRNPRHIRGGSISNDLSEVQATDQIIPMRQCEPDMLVPLLHRHHEMKQLMLSNAAQFARLRTSLGEENFARIEKVWCSLRDEIDDSEWLRQTQELLPARADWSLWCGMVGWDPIQPIMPSPKKCIVTEVDRQERRKSTSSLLEAQHTIREEDEW